MDDLQPFSIAYYPTIITPFTQDGTIDYPSLENLIRFFHTVGMDGIFAVCQSSEMFFLTDDEKVELASFCVDLCRRLTLRCVVSGHTQDDIQAQIAYLKRIEALGPDAVILVSNRLAKEEEPDAVCIRNLEKITGSLGAETRLGVYECPYPYKRLLSEEVIGHLAADRRFEFIKDTCCDEALIARRIGWLKGSNLKLYNANAATLLPSLRDGAAGFSGVYLNVIPELFALLRKQLRQRPDERIMYGSAAARIADYLTQFSIMERQNYPANAKYWLMTGGIIAADGTRNGMPALNPIERLQIDALRREYWLNYASWLRKPEPEFAFADGEAFESCHASTVLPLENGDVLVSYFAGTGEGADDVGIWLSARRGDAWEAPVRIAKMEPAAHWNPVLFQTGEGIRLVFKVGKDIQGWKSFTMRSADHGKTWSAPVPVDERNTAGGPVRSKPIRYGDVLLAPGSDETDGVWTPHVDRSADDGKTFQRLAEIPVNRENAGKANYIAGHGAIQPTLWADADGELHALLRTTGSRIFRSDSRDGGKTWREAYATGLPNNNSGIDVATDGGTLYLAGNPTTGSMGLRTPLVIWRSDDGGKTFQIFLSLQDALYDTADGKMAEFSYPAMVVHNGILHVTYTLMRRQIAYSRIDLRKAQHGGAKPD